ncbi:hypothetical protein L2E82_02653 [Cichorium intybus]|uniref:Uncharacterized protein n=1 Tax=Cichorium intybus TaxID=13427 RepID=A0ACB9H1W0_CICIN|nr:hypothetical protein L2E82_02653 [Cichorium intybus]
MKLNDGGALVVRLRKRRRITEELDNGHVEAIEEKESGEWMIIADANYAIILLEQSLASEKAGLAVSKKWFTLNELLQQTSHHNAKFRRDIISLLTSKMKVLD